MFSRASVASIVLFVVGMATAPVCAEPIRVIRTRDGLPNVMARLRSGKPARIAYFGASITNGGTASDSEKTSWRALTTAWFRTSFPNSRITEINHNISGNGSTLGAFRVHRDVIAHKPDLVFVEFAVNDLGTSKNRIARAMEGIVRQIRRTSPQTDICFVYTLFQSYLPQFKKGALPYTMVEHERIAAHYGIPSVNVALTAAERINSGNLSWNDFSKDVCHPTDKGYRIYFDVLRGFLAKESKRQRRPKSHAIPKPLLADCWEHVELRPAIQSTLPKGWSAIDAPKLGDLKRFAGSQTPGAEYTIRFRGTTIGLYFCVSPDTGNFDYRIDNGKWTTFRPLEDWFPELPMSTHTMIADDLSSGEHTLTLRIREDKNPKSTGRWTRIAYFLVGQQ